METGTESLLRAAPQWSLAGDKDLLDVLQNLHQRIISKCQETNRRLDEMVTALDDASVHLQNVNNRFNALSNRQFIESRVYDDDADVISQPTAPAAKEQPKPADSDNGEQLQRSLQVLESLHETVTILCDSDSETSSDEDDNVVRTQKSHPKPADSDNGEQLQRSLQVLESLHETVTILCDSDSETSSDEDDNVVRMVLKPKDLYAHRPLPHIIGSQAWKSKWHAGLQPDDDSDTNSESSKPDTRDVEQYSDSETESPGKLPSHPDHPVHPGHPGHRETSIPHAISTSSSEISESESMQPVKPQPMTQSDIAAELARRLGGVTKMPEQDVDDSPPVPTVRKLYKPEQPKTALIFPDEPPPLDIEQSEESDQDIFAEIHKTQPYKQSSREQSTVADDLFGTPVFDDVDSKVSSNPSKQKSTLFDEDSEPELFVEKPKLVQKVDDISSKKPIGGKSLFGSNAESIGAAILKRNQRHDSTPSDSDNELPKTANKEKPKQVANKPHDIIKTQSNKQTDKGIKSKVTEQRNETKEKRERDIFDDLFAKSEKINKEKEVTVKDSKVDIFSDNLFDDIDDIFTDNISKPVKKDSKAKSFFDDDDLFSDVAVKSNKDNDIFGSDDLFGKDKKTNVSKSDLKPANVDKIIKETQSLFDDSDDDIFSDVKISKNKTEKVNKDNNFTKNDAEKTKNDVKDNIFSHKSDDLFANESAFKHTEETPKSSIKIDKLKSAEVKSTKTANSSPFDDEDDDIFDTQSKLSNSNEIQSTSTTTMENVIKTASIKNVSDEILENVNKNNNIDKEEEKSTKIDKNILEVNDDIFSDTIAKTNPLENPANAANLEADSSSNIFNKDRLGDDIFQNSKPIPDERPVIGTVKPNITKKPATTSIADNISEKVVKPGISKKPVINQPTDTKAKSLKDETQKATDNKQTDATDVKSAQGDDNEKGFKAKHNVIKELDPTDIKKETKQDAFTDIFNDQPPIFEKPKEPKRSKNINALFDDDSDDEALFFKKSDVVDEKIEDFSSESNEDRLFGLFLDEPPAIDVDFVQKPSKSDVKGKDLQHKSKDKNSFDVIKDGIEKSSDSNIFAYNIIKTDLFSDITDDIFQKPAEKDFLNEFTDENTNKNDELDSMFEENTLQTHKSDTITNKEKLKDSEVSKIDVQEPKKVGKLKPMNFNINVNTLLPGASPKKVPKSPEQTDGQVISTKSTEELRTNDEREVETKEIDTKLVKSVSFEGEPDSSTLDNKLSKERAKIQVKRRPSTRRARREAVKKSGIDFGEDSTDNSSSIDDTPKSKANIETKPSNKQFSKTTIPKDTDSDEAYNENEITFTKSKIENAVSATVVTQKEALKVDSESTSLFDAVTSDLEGIDNKIEEKEIEGRKAASVSKVVYVLNDEDIFNIKPEATKTSDIFNDGQNLSQQRSNVKTEDKTQDLKARSSKADIFEDILEPKGNDSFSDDELLFKTTATKDNNAVNSQDLKVTSSENDNLFKDVPVQKASGTLIDDDDLLFKTTVPKDNNTVKNQDSKVVSSENDNLFKDFPVQKSSKTFSDDDAFFKTAVPKDTNSVKTQDSKGTKSENNNLFKDVQKSSEILSDDDDNLFKTTAPNDNNTVSNQDLKSTESENDNLFKNISVQKSSEIFSDDDDALFKTPVPKDKNTARKQEFEDLKKESSHNVTPKRKTEEITVTQQKLQSKDLFKKQNKKPKEQTKVSIFDDIDDEELFTNKKDKQKQPILDSGSGKELLFGKKKEKEGKEIKKIETKGPLFGDDDDDDDLFGVKTKKNIDKPQSSRSVTKEVSKPSAPVFEDPLSLLKDDYE